MGWDFAKGASKADIINEITKTWTSSGSGVTYSCIKKKTVGSALWTAWEETKASDPDHKVRWIGCDLLKSKKDYGWGNKGMDERMHPYNYSCPLEFLEAVPEVRCAEWRGKVLEWHETQARIKETRRLLEAGAMIEFETPLTFRNKMVVSRFTLEVKGKLVFRAVAGFGRYRLSLEDLARPHKIIRS